MPIREATLEVRLNLNRTRLDIPASIRRLRAPQIAHALLVHRIGHRHLARRVQRKQRLPRGVSVRVHAGHLPPTAIGSLARCQRAGGAVDGGHRRVRPGQRHQMECPVLRARRTHLVQHGHRPRQRLPGLRLVRRLREILQGVDRQRRRLIVAHIHRRPPSFVGAPDAFRGLHRLDVMHHGVRVYILRQTIHAVIEEFPAQRSGVVRVEVHDPFRARAHHRHRQLRDRLGRWHAAATSQARRGRWKILRMAGVTSADADKVMALRFDQPERFLDGLGNRPRGLPAFPGHRVSLDFGDAQQPGYLGVAALGRQRSGRFIFAGHRRIGTRRQQQFHRARRYRVRSGRVHQRRIAPVIPRIHRRTGGDQQFHGLRYAGRRRESERRFKPLVQYLRVGTLLQQQLDRSRIPVGRRRHQGRRPGPVLGVHIGALRQQLPHLRSIAPHGSRHQRRLPARRR